MKKDLITRLLVVVAVLAIAIAAIQFPRIITLYEVFAIENETKSQQDLIGRSQDSQSNNLLTVYILEPASTDELGTAIFSNIRHALDYARVPFQVVQSQELSRLEVNQYKILVLIGESLPGVTVEFLQEFTENQGNIAVANRLNRPDLDAFFGIEESNGFTRDTETGLYFETPLFPGYENIDEDSNLFAHSMLDAYLVPEAQVIMRTNDLPVMWKMAKNNGQILYSNTTMFTDKYTRGLFVQGISLLPPVFWVSQAGIKVFHIDDFPAPIPGGEISAELTGTSAMSVQQFYQQTWWEDMLEISTNFDLIYTGFIIGTYEDEAILETAELIELEQLSMTYFGRKLLHTGGELGLHGYNHQSLVTREEPIDPELGYVPWESQQEMEIALDTIDETFKRFYPNYEISSYVPPSNVLNRTGIGALAESFPHLTNISSLYIGMEEGGALIQEFEPDPEFEAIYHFPRVTSGYLEEAEERFRMVDAIANMGVFAHFVHPDDVLDEFRNRGRDWGGMREDLTNALETMNKNYPHMEPMAQRDAVDYWKLYEKSLVNASVASEAISLQSYDVPGQVHGYLRVNDPNVKITTGKFPYGQVIQADGVEGLYFVELDEGRVTLE